MVAIHAPCPYCGCFLQEEVHSQVGPHYGYVRCCACLRKLRWLPWPGQTKPRRPAAHQDLVRKYGRGFCELCLRDEAALPEGTVLEAHHVQAFADGGSSARENVWIVCTLCHRAIHTIRWATAAA